MPEPLLLIDDDVRLSQMLVQYLAEAGYAVTCAHCSGLMKPDTSRL